VQKQLSADVPFTAIVASQKVSEGSHPFLFLTPSLFLTLKAPYRVLEPFQRPQENPI